MDINFIAIDFETANGKRTSAVSVGIVPVENGVIVKERCKYFLICPPENDFNRISVAKHKLTWNDVKDAPNFRELWNTELKEILDSKTIVCHSKSSDKAVLEQSLSLYGLEGSFQFIDTLDIARQFYDFENKKLSTLCDKFGINLDNPHHALYDAMACAEVAIKMFLELGRNTDDFISNKAKKKHRNSLESLITTHPKILSDNLVPDFEFVQNKENPFYKKKVVISGTYDTWPDRNDLAKVIKSLGAYISSSVSGKTNILIAGHEAGEKKLNDMQKNIDAGKDSVILTESDVLQIMAKTGIYY